MWLTRPRRARPGPGRQALELHHRMLMGYGGVYVADAADFDGTNDYATRGATLTGIADSKLMTLVMWLKSELAATQQGIFGNATTVGGATLRLQITKEATNKLQIVHRNAAGGGVLNIASSSGLSNAWTCIMASVDMTDTGKRHLYFGDTSELTVTTYVDDTFDHTVADWSVAAAPSGIVKYDGGMAELMFWPNVYIDFSSQSNRRLFYNSVGKPANPAGAVGTLGAPAVYFHLDDGETANNFVANNDRGATGGAFTVTGALSTYASSPTD